MNAKPRILSRAIRTILWWQLLATAAMSAAAAAAMGAEAALSAALGGGVSIGSGLAAAVVASRQGGGTAGGVLAVALTAEAVKIGMIALLLWLVLATYREVVAGVFVGSFVVTALIFSMAFFVRDY